MANENRRYHSYLLRLWQVEQNGRLTWRASLEDAQTGKRLGFASPAALYAFLDELWTEQGRGSAEIQDLKDN